LCLVVFFVIFVSSVVDTSPQEIQNSQKYKGETMATKAPDTTMTGPNYASAEYAEQWRRGKRLRGEASEAVTEMMLDLAKIQVGDRVLELAAGMGDLAIMTARLVGPNGYVLATDISANMLDLAAETARDAGLTNVETRVMDAENLDVAPDSFNVALCRFALMLFPNALKALAGVHRALKPAGRFAVTCGPQQRKIPFMGCRWQSLVAWQKYQRHSRDSPGCSPSRVREYSKLAIRKRDSAMWRSEQFRCNGISLPPPKP
jgi:SAM-dependent methyltransferase